MAANVLVDSSYFIAGLRAGEDPLQELDRHADEIELYTCGMVTVEVLRGLKPRSAHERMARYLGCMRYIPTLNKIWEQVASLAWRLDRKGCFMQVSDLVIASCALEADAAVLTFDSDFQNIPNLRVLDRLA